MAWQRGPFIPVPMLAKNTLRLALLAAAVATTGLTAQAAPHLVLPTQTGPGPRGNIFKDLNLTPEQQTQVEALMKEQRGQRPSGPPTDADRQAMQARRAELDTKLKAILTPEQYTKYQAMRPQRGPRPTPVN